MVLKWKKCMLAWHETIKDDNKSTQILYNILHALPLEILQFVRPIVVVQRYLNFHSNWKVNSQIAKWNNLWNLMMLPPKTEWLSLYCSAHASNSNSYMHVQRIFHRNANLSADDILLNKNGKVPWCSSAIKWGQYFC